MPRSKVYHKTPPRISWRLRRWTAVRLAANAILSLFCPCCASGTAPYSAVRPGHAGNRKCGRDQPEVVSLTDQL